MAKSSKQTASNQKHTRRLRRCNVQMLVITIVMLALLCSILIARTQKLNDTIANLTAEVEMLSRIVENERAQSAHLVEELRAVGRLDISIGQQAVQGQETSGGVQQPTVQGQETSGGVQQPTVRGQEIGGGVQQTTVQGQEVSGGVQQMTVQRQETKGEMQQTAAQVTATHKVYLTFDDGPSSRTQDILDILKQYGVKATFFVVGKDGETAKESLKQIVEDGHTLGMHSGTHKYAELYASIESFSEDFEAQREYLHDVTGVQCDIYRFPGGSSNTVKTRAVDMADLARYLDGQGIHFFDWNISSGDGGSVVLPVETLVENCTANISKYETSIILMHDSSLKSTTVEALPKIIETIQGMENTVILPITDETKPVQHIQWQKEP